MGKRAEKWTIPPQALVEVVSEPGPDLLCHHGPALAALLRMALLGGVEFTLPTTLHLLLDVCQSVVRSDRQLILFTGANDFNARMQLGRNFTPPRLPEMEGNLLQCWVKKAAKPLLVQHGLEPGMDTFLRQVQAKAAVAAPLFLEHNQAGSIQLFRHDGDPYTSSDGQLLWILSLLAETQMVRINAMQQLTRVAFTDYLTGLRTRGYFEQALEQEVRRALRNSSSCGLLLVDLDNFKRINDGFGHNAGDEILRQFARIFTRDMREIDTVARFGGDEFAVILPDTFAEGARFVAHRAREAVRSAHFHIPEAQHAITLDLSIGVALCPSDECNPGQLMRAADLALYQAKRHGRGRPIFWRELHQLE